MNTAVNFLLDMDEYKVERNMTESNPHIKVDLDLFDEEGDYKSNRSKSNSLSSFTRISD